MLKIHTDTGNGNKAHQNIPAFIIAMLNQIGINDGEFSTRIAYKESHITLPQDGIRISKANFNSVELVVSAHGTENQFLVFLSPNGGMQAQDLYQKLSTRFGRFFNPSAPFVKTGVSEKPASPPQPTVSSEIDTTNKPQTVSATPLQNNNPAPSEPPIAQTQKAQEVPEESVKKESRGKTGLFNFTSSQDNIGLLLLAFDELPKSSDGYVHKTGLGVAIATKLGHPGTGAGKAIAPMLHILVDMGFIEHNGYLYRLTEAGKNKIAGINNKQAEQTQVLAVAVKAQSADQGKLDNALSTGANLAPMIEKARQYREAMQSIESVSRRISHIEKELLPKARSTVTGLESELCQLKKSHADYSGILADPVLKKMREDLAVLREFLCAGDVI